MKKRLLLLTAVLSASVNFMFAQTQTVLDSNGNEFTYDTKNDLDAISEGGDTTFSTTPSVIPNSGFNMITLNSDQAMKINNCHLTYNVKLKKISENPGTIAPFTQRIQSSATIYDVVVNRTEFLTYINDEIGPYAFSVNTESDAYINKYLVACKRANKISPSTIIPGSAVPVEFDNQEMEVNTALYYMVEGLRVKKYIPILDVNGTYSTGVSYTNSFNTFNPVGIADNYKPYKVNGDGKVGFVSGVVDNGTVQEILSEPAYTYLNYDFSNASILGSVTTDINDNRIAYFATGANASGKNIVVGQNSVSYEISDNGQEIYVYKNFIANDTKYYRNFKADTYGTIVVPFNISSASDVFRRMGRLTGYDEEKNEISTTMAELIVANTPYLLEISSNASELTGDMGTTVWATKVAKSEKYNGAQFFGTFEPIKGSNAILADHGYVVGENGHFGKLNQNSTMKPGRCYFEYVPTAGGNAKLDNATVLFIDEETGTVETMKANFDQETTAIDGVVNSSDVVLVQYISANGQISNEPVNGLNIVKKTYSDGSVEISKVIF